MKTKQKKEKLVEHLSTNINYKLGNIKKVKHGNQLKSNLTTCEASSETQRQIVEARESLNGR